MLNALRHVMRTTEPTLELPEPLYMRFLPRWVVLAMAARVRNLSGRGPKVGIFAIENNDLQQLISPSHRLPPLILTAARGVLRHVVGPLVDRWAFGTTAAYDRYERIFGTEHLKDATVIGALLPVSPLAQTPKLPLTAAFTGRLEQRKGVVFLLRAWEAVEKQLPSAHLTLFGSGPLEQTVIEWVGRRPATRAYAGSLPRVAAMTRRARIAVQVAPSIRDGRWREQVGLPITEALALGMTVVTTDETGLAEELRNDGHFVVPCSELESRLESALTEALRRPLPIESVIAALPHAPGRRTADEWLHR